MNSYLFPNPKLIKTHTPTGKYNVAATTNNFSVALLVKFCTGYCFGDRKYFPLLNETQYSFKML